MDSPLPFESGPDHVSLPGLAPGIASLQDVCKTAENEKYNELLKTYGLSDNEIKIYKDFNKGMQHLDVVHKNLEKSALHKIIQDINQKIENARIEFNNSIQHKLEDNEGPPQTENKNTETILTHPINSLNDLKDDLFGYMDVDKLPTANKRRKFTRRMTRKFNKPIPIPEPAACKSTSIDEVNHGFNDFIRCKTNPNINSKHPDFILNRKSKWDIKDVDPPKKSIVLSNENSTIQTKRKIGCSSQTMYTIKNNKIIRLEKINKNSSDYKLTDIKLPINKAEEKLLEGTKLSIEDIKKLTKFEKYCAGEPSNVLFIKNLSNNINEGDLKSLFNVYQNYTNIRMMTGKMKGQAFITFNSLDTAVTALHENNGTIIKGKPIIIQFGKQGNR
ncbi:uncharacterized protein LOC143916432 [Arctopsyche grandis]|uniref:uncharacterized protein LOC143916432 n=1 Tax=Arctopsyche grandis TaxID=121162 RepID=UPI00406DA4CA